MVDKLLTAANLRSLKMKSTIQMLVNQDSLTRSNYGSVLPHVADT